MDTYARRETVERILKSEGRICTAELAERLGVCINTIKNDIRVLGRSIPIVSAPGRKGGYFYTGEKNVEITEKEATALKSVLERYPDEMSPELYRTILAKLEKFSK